LIHYSKPFELLHGEALPNVRALHGTITVDSPRLVAAGYVAERIHAKARIDGRKVGLDGSATAYGAAATVAAAPDAGGLAARATLRPPALIDTRRCRRPTLWRYRGASD